MSMFRNAWLFIQIPVTSYAWIQSSFSLSAVLFFEPDALRGPQVDKPGGLACVALLANMRTVRQIYTVSR
jgi:hypothetical protein